MYFFFKFTIKVVDRKIKLDIFKQRLVSENDFTSVLFLRETIPYRVQSSVIRLSLLRLQNRARTPRSKSN